MSKTITTMPDTPNIIDVDARFLEPPEPFERTLEALDRLEPGGEVRLRIHREPHPLYQMLQQSGYRYSTEFSDEGYYLVRISVAGD